MATLNVELGNRSYPIIVGNGLLRDEALLAPYISGDEVVVLTNETIAPLYLDQVTTSLKDRQLICQVLPDGEQFKNLDTLQSIFDTLLENRCSRATTLIALGGGVIGGSGLGGGGCGSFFLHFASRVGALPAECPRRPC